MRAWKRAAAVLVVVVAAVAAFASSAAMGAGSAVAICATMPSYDGDVQTKLAATGLFSAVDDLDCSNSTPSLATLQGYQAVLAYTDGSFADTTAMTQNLADYADGGGRLVIAMFASADWSLGGTVLDTGGYLPFVLGSQQAGDGPLTLVADNPSSDLLAGVDSFSGGDSSYRALVSLASGATLVAHWSDVDSTPLVAYKGNVIGLNFYPPSTDARSDFWDASTDGVRLMTNALGASIGGGQVNRAGYCLNGQFVDLATDQPTTDPHFKSATPALYYQGKGISCDNLPGYTKTGETVGYGGHGDPGSYTYMAKN